MKRNNKLKIVTIFLLILFSPGILSQTICEGLQVVPIVTFNQCDYNPWILVFEENFDGTNLDLSRWEFGPRIRYCNDEQQYYTSGNNLELSNGTLNLIAKREQVHARAVDWLPDEENLYCKGVDKGKNLRYFDYTSANIETTKKFSFGKLEARIKIPKGKGFWPAFWMWSGEPVYNEIDVFEFWNQNNIFNKYDPSLLTRVHNMTVHHDFEGNGTSSMCLTSYTGNDFSLVPHIFTVIWEKNKIEFYVDGVLKRTDFRYYTLLGQSTGCTIEKWKLYILNKIYPKHPMHIILNFAIQDGYDKWGNYKAPDDSTPFPSIMEVDWVRFYQKHPCGDKFIIDASQFPLENLVYNVLAGEAININCNFTVLPGQHLEVIANTNITIGPGFNSEIGSTLCARIDPGICSKSSLNSEADLYKDSYLTNFEFGNFEGNEIQIFPNPSNGIFTIDFGQQGHHKNYAIEVRDIMGNLIISLESVNKSQITLDLSGNSQGIYVLYLLNYHDNSLTTYKLILQ